MKRLCMTVSLFTLMVFFLVSCDKKQSVSIHYEQCAECNGYPTAQGVASSGGPGSAFVIFKIKSISNTEADAVDYHFDKNNFHVDDAGKVGTTIPNPFPNLTVLSPFDVPKGTTKTLNGFIVAIPVVPGNGNCVQAAQTNYFLTTTAVGSQNVILTKDNSAGAPFGTSNPNCAALSY